MGILRKHCTGNLTVCDFANLCGLAKAALLVFSLLPQLILNWKRKSVEGLSVLWATAMFTAIFVHSFYVFGEDKYIFFKISIILVPAMKFAFLVQFWAYSRQGSLLKFSYAAGCVVFFGAILTLELCVPKGSDEKLEWIAVVFFSIDRFPQIFLNTINRSTVGQATPSVILSTLEETLGFLYYYLLIVGSEFQIMQFFATTYGYINLMQVLWYPRPVTPKRKKMIREYGTTSEDEEPYTAEESIPDETVSEPKEKTSQCTANTEEPQAVMISYMVPHTPNVLERIKEMPKGSLLLFNCLFLGIITFTACLCIKSASLWALLAPSVVIFTLLSTLIYRSYREGTLPCQEPSYPHAKYRVFKD